MDTKAFRKLAERLLAAHGFAKKGSYFYKRGDTVICVVYLQRSPHANGYYVCLGYVFVELHPDLEYPRDVDGDMRARFWFEHRGKSSDFFDLDDEELMSRIETIFADNILEHLPVPLSIEGIKAMIARDPRFLYQTRVDAKRFLGYA